LYPSPNIIGGTSRKQGGRESHNILIRLTEGKKPLGRSNHRLEGNIKIDLKEIGYKCVDWIQLAQDMVQWWAFINTVMNLWVP
jgi:hypothetical protein